MGSGAKSYIWGRALIYEEMRKFFPIYEEAVVTYDFAPDPSEFPYIRGKSYFLFYQ